MTCKAFYQAVQVGINCIGESCEECIPIPYLLPLAVIFCGGGLIMLIIAIIVHNKGIEK